MTEHIVIVGGGPAGLSVGRVLEGAGVPYTILERGPTAGSSWRNRYDSLQLHTARWLSHLPGARIPRSSGRWVSRDSLVEYLDGYAQRFKLRIEAGVEVTRVDRNDTGWRLETSNGARQATAVVIATGYSHSPWVPDWPGRTSFTGTFLHSAAYREPSPYVGKHVLVVGAGNSAAEIAVELARAGAAVDLSVRTPPNIVRRDVGGVPTQLLGIALRRVPERLMNPLTAVLRRLTVPDLATHGLPTPAGDGFSQFLRSRTVPILDHGFVRAVSSRQIRVVHAVASFDGADVLLADGTRLTPNAVVAATGYRPGLEPLVGHLGVLDETGMPLVHGSQTHPRAPEMFFVGIAVELAGLLRQIDQEARSVGRALSGPQHAPRI